MRPVRKPLREVVRGRALIPLLVLILGCDAVILGLLRLARLLIAKEGGVGVLVLVHGNRSCGNLL